MVMADQGTLCGRCGCTLDGRGVELGGQLLCALCYGAAQDRLDRQLEQRLTSVALPGAALGAVLGGVLGAALWWWVATKTSVESGLVAAGIGLLVARGAHLGGGGGRNRAGRLLVLLVSALGYLIGWQVLLADRMGQPLELPDLRLLPLHLRAHADGWDAAFLLITVFAGWQSYRLPRGVGR